jgi:hypothetical protein
MGTKSSGAAGHAGLGQFLVLELEEQRPGEPWQGGEVHAREDALGAQILGPLDRVVTPGNHVGVANRLVLPLLSGFTGHRVEPHRRRPLVLVDPELTSFVLDHMRCSRLKLLGHAISPHARRLDDVVIDAEQLVHDPPPYRSNAW